MLTTLELYEKYRECNRVSTDTRTLEPNDMFFALKGERFDGNAFALQALQAGARYAVVDAPAIADDPRCLLVPNVLLAMQHLAYHHRKQFEIPVIAIGGSNGKTTTKELVAAVLSSHYPCHFTQGNLNNHIGVPITLLNMPPETEVAIIEMGVNQMGDMEELCQIAAPSHGLLTNIGKEHLQGFGDIQGVVKAEGELFRYLARHQGWVFVNTSEPWLETMSEANERRIFYRRNDQPAHNETYIETALLNASPFISVAFLDDQGLRIEVHSQLIGEFNFNNIMTAIALGIYFKVPSPKIKNAIEQYQPANNRTQLIRTGDSVIILDAYNANPSSVLAALEALQSMPQSHKIAILGDMLELGAASRQEHEEILKAAASMPIQEVALLGAEFGKCSFAEFGMRHFDQMEDLKQWWASKTLSDAAVLIKGSRGLKMERLLGSDPVNQTA